MKHRLLTTLVGTILCLGWCMSANGQTNYFLRTKTKVNGTYVVRYLGVNSSKFRLEETPTTKWNVTDNKNGSIKFNVSVDTNQGIKYGTSSNADYAFTLGSSETFYLFKQDDNNKNQFTKADGFSSNTNYLLLRESQKKYNLLSNIMVNTNKTLATSNTAYLDRAKVTECNIDRDKDGTTPPSGTITFGTNGVGRNGDGSSTEFSYENYSFAFVEAVTYYGSLTLENNGSSFGSVSIKEGTTTKTSPITINETVPKPDDNTLHKTYTLTATPNNNCDFLGWTITDETGTHKYNDLTYEYTFNITSQTSGSPTEVTITANFAQHHDCVLNGTYIDDIKTNGLEINDGVPIEGGTGAQIISSFVVGDKIEGINVTYNRQITNAAWQPWFTPFEFTLTQELLDNYRFAKIAGAFADVDNNNTKYISFVAINNVGETIKANVPYIVYARNANGTPATYPFSFTGINLEATTTNNELTIQSAEQKFTFKGLYTQKTSDATGNTPASWYTLNKNGEFKRPGVGVTINGFRFIMEVTDLENNPYFVEGEAGIRVRVFSDMPCDWIDDDPTWVVTPKAKAEASSEAYDLTGRKMSKEGMHRRGQIFIKNGKKYWNR